MEFSKQYSPKEFEHALYTRTEELWLFQPTTESKTGRTFYIPIPPPNVTGNLHIGHALTLTLEDIMVRYHRMRGDSTVWIPGTDHAGIATQARVEKLLAEQGKSRESLGREAFLAEVWKWKDEYAANINNQARKLGASLDWTKERFTFDEKSNKLVEHTFVDLYKKGLIYRGEYMVNYSPWIQSVISDIEVDYKEEDAKMYYITYFVSGSDNEFTIATTRPETLLADMAVAVHPKDKRYKKMIGRKAILPIVNKEIPIIWDDTIDREFGSGAMKITPAHDPTDFELGKKHGLRLDYSVIDKNGKMNSEAGIFEGQDAATTARENIVELLKAKWNLLKVEPYTHKVGYCSRSGSKIETIISTQWFIRANDMIKKVITWYQKKEFQFIPARFNNDFEDWAFNLRDWCISRQLWWGHQIPAYFDAKTGELLEVTLDPTALFEKYGKENIRRDDDVLDTWFSSWLWPYSILDWHPENPGELFKKFYPANVLETGYDILFFWVIRMLMFGYEYTGQTPFKTVYLHGLVLDETGRKMSKSWGNVINPLDIIETNSTDSLRLSLAIGNTPGNNLNFSIKLVDNNQVFLNKFWNIARFIATNIWEITESYEDIHARIVASTDALMPHEKWIMSRFSYITDSVTQWMERYEFSAKWQELVSFIRDEFADFAVEEYKLTKEISSHGKDVMTYGIMTLLKLLHPYAPLITEEIYNRLTGGKYLMTSSWPEVLFKRDEQIEKDMNHLYEVIREVRNIRAVKWVKPGVLVDTKIIAGKKSRVIVESNEQVFKWLAKIGNLEFCTAAKAPQGYSFGVVGDTELYLDTSAHVDTEGEMLRLKKEIDEKREYVRILDMKLTNTEFVRNAPEKIVRLEQEKRFTAIEQISKLEEKYKMLEV
jgi:valyl-tRNA synthetase